ncbi:hypothetical protein BGZ79_004983, partial [Entomortierella chlamydospora]
MASYSTTTLQDLMQTLSLGPQTSSRPPAITTASDKTPHHNIAVRQKAVMQLVFRYGRWLGDEKQLKTEGPERQHQSKPDIELLSVAEIESQLPPLRCPQASIVDYVNKLEEVGIRFMDFYNGNNNKFQKYNWDMKRAKYIEYQAIANSLLRIVGGSIGERRKDDNPVLIGVDLCQFGRISLGYIIVDLDEFYTSKKCPDFHEFFAQVTLRKLFCRNCGRHHHRDIMAAENMSNIAREYLLHQERPLYLHPVTPDGRYPWMESSPGQETADGAIVGTSDTT